MLLFSCIAPLGDAVTKILGALVPIIYFTLFRFGLQALLLTPFLARPGRQLHLTRRDLGLIFIRTLCHLVGLGAVFMALRYLPLADAIAIAFVMPFISLLIGKYFLGEEVGHRRLIACCVGFVGTLFVIQPSFVTVGAAALWPLLAAFAFAFFMLTGRQLAQAGDPITIQMISGYMACACAIPLFFVGNRLGWEGFAFFVPEGRTLYLLLLVGVLGTVAHLCMTWALKFAPSTTLAPLTYIEIPITTFVGFLIFGDLPNHLATIGIMITMAAGLYIVFRERANLQATATETV